jgi:N-acetylglutamate synthase-like GNAT family acetyltransferase
VGGLLGPPGPVIRPATPADQAAATGLLGAGTGESGEPGTDGSETDPPVRLVATEGERVVGAVAVRRVGTLGLVDGPVVEEGWRGRLVGTRLVVAACIQGRAVGLERVAGPAAAESFLTRLGFRPVPGQDPPLVREL